VPNPDRKGKPEMYATVWVLLAERDMNVHVASAAVCPPIRQDRKRKRGSDLALD